MPRPEGRTRAFSVYCRYRRAGTEACPGISTSRYLAHGRVGDRPRRRRWCRGIRTDTLVRMPASLDDFYAVIPAGGIGSRLWPLSRADAPKFLHDLTGSGQLAAARHLGPPRAPAGPGPHRRRHRTRAPRRRRGASCPASPTTTSSSSPSPATPPRRSAWPPRSSHRREPDVIIGSFAADHVIRGTARVRVRRAPGGRRRPRGLHLHDRHHPVRAGGRVRIHQEGRGARSSTGARRRRSSRASSRSPTSRPRKQYFADRSYLWNAGMFISRADVLLAEIAANNPKLHAGLAGAGRGLGRPRPAAPSSTASGRRCTKIAIDYAVAEPAAAEGQARGHPRPLRLGRRGRLREPGQAQLRRPQERPRDPRRERARPVGRGQRHRRQPDRRA